MSDSRHRDPERLEEEIENSRERIDRTLDELGREFSPGQMLDRALGYTKEHGADFADNLVTTISHNPVPALLTGVGLVWLATSRRHGPPRRVEMEYEPVTRDPYDPAYDERYYQRGEVDFDDDEEGRFERVKEGAASAARSAKHKAEAAAHSAKHKAESAADSVRSGARSAAHGASEAASRAGSAARHAGRSARHQAEAAGRQIQSWHEQNPLVMGGLAFALGAALGAATPNTRREDEMFGEYGEEIRDRAGDEFDKGKAKAEREFEKGKAKAAEKASEVAEKARDKVREAGDEARKEQREKQKEARSEVRDKTSSSKTPPPKSSTSDTKATRRSTDGPGL